MLDWLKITKNYPAFWKIYLENLDKKNSRTVVITLQISTALGNESNILSIAALGINDNMIDVGDCFEIKIKHESKIFTSDKNGEMIINEERNEVQIEDAIQAFINFISNATLVGHRIDYDIEIINDVLKKMNCGLLKNQALDLEIMFRKLKNFSENKNIEIKEIFANLLVERSDRNAAIFDAYDLAIAFLKMKSKLRF